MTGSLATAIPRRGRIAAGTSTKADVCAGTQLRGGDGRAATLQPAAAEADELAREVVRNLPHEEAHQAGDVVRASANRLLNYLDRPR